MKTILTLISALALVPALKADDYTVFHVCQDQHVIHTSDGADGGHVEYIVFDPGSHRIVSTVVTGGVVGEKFVAVPFESMRFNGDREVLLNDITRERFVSAPVIERTQITSTTIQPTVFERTSQHFGVRFDANINLRDGDRRDGDRRDGDRRDMPQAGRPGPDGQGRRDGDRDRDHDRREGKPDGQARKSSDSSSGRDGSMNKDKPATESSPPQERTKTDAEKKKDKPADPASPPEGRSNQDKPHGGNADMKKPETSKADKSDNSPATPARKESPKEDSAKPQAKPDRSPAMEKKRDAGEPAAPTEGKAPRERTAEKADGKTTSEKPKGKSSGDTGASEGEIKRKIPRPD